MVSFQAYILSSGYVYYTHDSTANGEFRKDVVFVKAKTWNIWKLIVYNGQPKQKLFWPLKINQIL